MRRLAIQVHACCTDHLVQHKPQAAANSTAGFVEVAGIHNTHQALNLRTLPSMQKADCRKCACSSRSCCCSQPNPAMQITPPERPLPHHVQPLIQKPEIPCLFMPPQPPPAAAAAASAATAAPLQALPLCTTPLKLAAAGIRCRRRSACHTPQRSNCNPAA